MIVFYFRVGRTIVGGNVVTGGSSDEADFLALCMSNSSMTTSAAIASTMGTARGTTQGSCRPRAANVPGVPSYWAVSCDCEIVAGDLKPILDKKKKVVNPLVPSGMKPEIHYLPEVDVLAIRYPTLHPTTPIGCRTEVTILLAYEGVIVFAPGDLRPTEARANFESLRRRDGEHCVSELGFELVKYGFAKPGGNVANDAGDRTTYRVLGIFGSDDALMWVTTNGRVHIMKPEKIGHKERRYVP